MDPRITSIENLIAADPGGRNIFGLALADQLGLAAQSLRLAKRVAIVSGFYVAEAGAGETDGPPGAKVLGEALEKLGIEVDYITDALNAPLFHALGVQPLIFPVSHPDVRRDQEAARRGRATGYGRQAAAWSPKPEAPISYLDNARPTHLVSIERVGRGCDGRYRNMHGVDITEVTAPLDELFLEGSRRGLTTIGIGDGGNEIGMGKVFADAEPRALARAESPCDPRTSARAESPMFETPRGLKPAAQCVVATDFCIAAGVSNWGAYGLAGALSVLTGRDLLPSASALATDLERIVREGGAVDGVTHRNPPPADPTVDGLALSASLGMLENIRRQLAPSPLRRDPPAGGLLVGVLGYGETGQAAAALLTRHGHRVCISDKGPVTLLPSTVAAGVEAGQHSIEFLGTCDLVVASPGVPADSPIFGALHRRGIPVMSELELAYQLSTSPVGLTFQSVNRQAEEPVPHLVAVTGTIGKRTTVELLQRLFHLAGRPLTIGGNRGRPLSALLLDDDVSGPVAVAVSSFQLETVVHFRPDVAILLNIDEAHLDRHRSIAEYIRIKSRIFMNHRADDALILPFDDERVRTLARKHQGRTFFVSSLQAVDRGAWLVDGVLRMNVDGKLETIGSADPPFPENLLAAAVAARLCGISTEQIVHALQRANVTGETT